MTALNFPSSPVDQQTFTDGAGHNFIYYATPGVWKNSSAMTYPNYFSMSQPGYVSGAVSGTTRFYPVASMTITAISASVSEVVTNNDVVFKIFKNGVDTGYTFTINTGNYTLSATTVSIGVTPTDYITLNMVSGVAYNLRVNFRYT